MSQLPAIADRLAGRIGGPRMFALLMVEKRIRHLLVVEGAKLLGIITDRDIRLNLPSPATSLSVWEINYLLARMTVASAMTKNVVIVSPGSRCEGGGVAVARSQDRRPAGRRPTAERAWATAQRMAVSYGAELVLLHVLPGTPLDVEMRLEAEERKAELRSLQAEHQLGIPRADDEEAAPASRVFEGPFTGPTLREFSPAGRAWAEMLETWAARGRRAGAKVRTVLRVGVPYREVLSEAKDSKVDLVLLATHGRGEIHRLLVGSVADRVIRMAPCPVFTLKEA